MNSVNPNPNNPNNSDNPDCVNKCIKKNNELTGYRCSGCNNNLAGLSIDSRYQRLKLIQNTVRVASSLYTMNLGALTAYQRPNALYKLIDLNGTNYIVSPGVNWNQMSDRKDPHIQTIKSGSKTALRPGKLSPGGSGVDVKHNSYDRYLNRLKGKSTLRSEKIPPLFSSPYIPFNRAYPIYGGKIVKTGIINKCDC